MSKWSYIHIVCFKILIILINNFTAKCEIINYEEPTTPIVEFVNRISAGLTAEIGQFPYQVMLLPNINSKGGLCSGSLISDQWVLTAAHCFSRPLLPFAILGLTDRNDTSTAVYRGIIRIVKHENLNIPHNDVALLLLSEPVDFTDEIKPILLPSKSMADVTFAGRMAVVSGWGRLGPLDNLYNRDTIKIPFADGTEQWLRYTSVPIISNKECQPSWKPTNSMLCTATADSGGASCQGDSGGPLVINDSPEYEAVVIGVVSFGDGKCPGRRPGVYSRVTAYLSWIEEITNIYINE